MRKEVWYGLRFFWEVLEKEGERDGGGFWGFWWIWIRWGEMNFWVVSDGDVFMLFSVLGFCFYWEVVW